MVVFFDEGRFGLKSELGRLWALKGVKPYSTVLNSYQNFYLYASVSPTTGESFTLLLPWVNTDMMSLYLKELSAYFSDKQLMVIMDQAGWHKAKELKIPDNINLEFLPAYSPELNPVEKLWQWLRRHACRNRFFTFEEELIETLLESLMAIPETKLASLCNCSYL